VFANEEETVEGLTRRQEQVLEFIRESVRTNGYPPTVREICVGLDLSAPSTVHVHLANLERLGFIRRDPTKPRALELVQDHRPGRPLPLIGQVAAGRPIVAEDNIEDYVDVPSFLRRDDGDFVLRVRGESMIRAGINDGDYLVVHPQQEVSPREIAVVRIDGEEATAKHFVRDGQTVLLEAENDDFETIIVNADRVELVGRVVGVLRQL
jgi:repressor LexA